MDSKIMQSSGLKKKKVTQLVITEEKLKINENDSLCVSEHLAQLLHDDEQIPIKRSGKATMKKKKIDPLEITQDDLALTTTDVLILPEGVYGILQSKGNLRVKLTPEKLLIMKEKQLVMTGNRRWKKNKMSKRFLRKSPKPKVWKIPMLRRGPLNYIHLHKLPPFWHKFMRHQSSIRRYKTMPTSTYDSLFLHRNLKGPVQFVASTGTLRKPFDNSMPTISLCWTKGEQPQVVDYAVHEHQKLNQSQHRIESTKRRIISEKNNLMRSMLYFFILLITTLETTKQLFLGLKNIIKRIGSVFTTFTAYFLFKFRHQILPTTFLALRRFFRAHIEFVFLLLQTFAHLTRWVKRSIRPLNL